MFNALTPEILADNTDLQNCLRRQTNSTDLWICLFVKLSVLKLKVLVSTNSNNYDILLYEKCMKMYFQ